MISLTALVLTYNEQENIRRNLDALVWVPKVIIVDSFSNDRTLEIARSFPNVQVVQREFDTHANQWNSGLDRIDTEWALTLDADLRADGGIAGRDQSGAALRYHDVLGRV
jgi:glycosyltransferase involved in cell wall biosynthesis